jgi:nickel-type superoxide dismutase maturation protease
MQPLSRIAAELVAWLCGRRRWFRVRGDSMYPTLKSGDCVLTNRNNHGLPTIGDIVVVHDPERDGAWLVKRVSSHGKQAFAVRSDNATEGRDSRQFGSLTPNMLIGSATLLFAKTGKLTVLPCVTRSRAADAAEQAS